MATDLEARRGLSRLTETERRIVALVAAGQTNDEVAERLCLSPKTVEWNLTRVYRKLEVHSRKELAAKLVFEATPQQEAGETPGTPLGPALAKDEPGGPLLFRRPRSDSPSANPEERGDS